MDGAVAIQKGTPKLAPFHITQADGNITKAGGVANTWTDIWTYEVPLGTGVILQAGDTLAVYLEDATAEVGNYDCYIKLEVRDPSGLSVGQVFGPSLYNRVKEFQNRNTIARLGVYEPVKVYPRQKIVLCVKDNGAINASNSYFDLFTSKVAVPLAQ